jgi:glycosyltransferase involved in cell wall biosynthesis
MAGCVVLNSITAGNDSVGDAGCGITVESENVKQVVDGLRTLLALPVSERKRMGERGRSYVLRGTYLSCSCAAFL